MTRSRQSIPVLAMLIAAADARAQACPTTVVRTAPAAIGGAYIRTVVVRTDAPVTLPFAGEWPAALRRTTVSRVVRRQLLFAAGGRADTTRIAETLRRLRDQRIYSDVALSVRQCDGSDSVDLVVTTRDAWTLRPVARIVPPSTISVGVEDRNVLGTGRILSISSEETSRGHGGSMGLTDPFLFGTNIVGAVRFSDVAGNHILRASARHHELSVLDEWRGELAVGRQTFSDLRAPEHPLASFYLVADVGHRIGSSTRSVTVPYTGIEVDSGGVVAMRRGDVAATVHSRSFVGIDAGVQHRAAQFDTVSWFVPNRGFLDTPTGFEEDVLISTGRDRGQDAVAARYDVWAGRVWIPRRGHILTTDVWASGYLGNVRNNHVDRIAVSEYNQAARGFWGGRLMFEQLLEVDPDLRGVTLATINADPSFSAVPALFRLANRAVFASAERAVHVVPFGRASMVDAGVFAAGSVRWDAPNTTTQAFGMVAAGFRVRLISTNGLVNSTRVDVSYPIHANAPIARRPLLSVSFGPLFDLARQRDGRRRQQ